MDLTGRTLWQVGAGDSERQYGDLCLEYDVMIAGPGDLGSYVDSEYQHLGDARNSLRRFCTEARKGDLVLLRLGTGDILAVGQIEDEASGWSEAFADIDGWDLQHFRRVRWFDDTANRFPSKTLGGQVRTFASVGVGQVRDWVAALNIPAACLRRELKPLPETGSKIDQAQLGERLFVEGLPSEYVDNVLDALASIRRVAAWYSNESKRPEGRPSEDETICYLVIPLLMSLGWSQQTVALQWNYVDVALFSRMPSSDATLACVLEAKLLGKSVFLPVGKASGYATRPGRESCDRLIITDGIRYALHRRTERGFRLESYLNVLSMRDSYPVYHCGGAVQALLGMSR